MTEQQVQPPPPRRSSKWAIDESWRQIALRGVAQCKEVLAEHGPPERDSAA